MSDGRVAGYRAAEGAGSFYCSTDLCRPVVGDSCSPRPESGRRIGVDVFDRRLAVEELPYDHAGDAREQDAAQIQDLQQQLLALQQQLSTKAAKPTKSNGSVATESSRGLDEEGIPRLVCRAKHQSHPAPRMR